MINKATVNSVSTGSMEPVTFNIITSFSVLLCVRAYTTPQFLIRGYVRNYNPRVHIAQGPHFILKFEGFLAKVLEIHGFTSRGSGNPRVHRNPRNPS